MVKHGAGQWRGVGVGDQAEDLSDATLPVPQFVALSAVGKLIKRRICTCANQERPLAECTFLHIAMSIPWVSANASRRASSSK